ncbi:hypothetical protein BT96DRAFT_834297, partial [Gymnopus androsaceus JB14]
FSYAASAKSTQANPCSNIPIWCPVCTQINPNSPAIWCYNAEEHFKIRHPNINCMNYTSLWEISNSEHEALAVVYRSQQKQPSRHG